jgi:hypothetical protein
MSKKKPSFNHELYDPIHTEPDSEVVKEFKKRKHIGSNRMPKKKRKR